MARRYEISDEHWEKIEHLLSGKSSDVGRTAEDNRTFVNAVFGFCAVDPWADLPERYGNYKSVNKR